MTDQPATQIFVRPSAAPVVLSESTKLILIAGLGFAADHFMHSETAIVAVMAAGGAIATAAWSVWVRLSNWGIMKKLANLVDDSIAVVGHPAK